MRKILGLFLVLFICVITFTACADSREYKVSIDDGDIAKLTLFTFDGKGESVWGLANLGHTFLSIENISDESIDIGKKPLPKGETLAIGTWSILDHFGVWYNVESNYIAEHNKYDGRVSITIGIDVDDLKKINESIATNDRWNPLNN